MPPSSALTHHQRTRRQRGKDVFWFSVTHLSYGHSAVPDLYPLVIILRHRWSHCHKPTGSQWKPCSCAWNDSGWTCRVAWRSQASHNQGVHSAVHATNLWLQLCDQLTYIIDYSSSMLIIWFIWGAYITYIIYMSPWSAVHGCSWYFETHPPVTREVFCRPHQQASALGSDGIADSSHAAKPKERTQSAGLATTEVHLTRDRDHVTIYGHDIPSRYTVTIYTSRRSVKIHVRCNMLYGIQGSGTSMIWSSSEQNPFPSFSESSRWHMKVEAHDAKKSQACEWKSTFWNRGQWLARRMSLVRLHQRPLCSQIASVCAIPVTKWEWNKGHKGKNGKKVINMCQFLWCSGSLTNAH